MSVSPSPLSSLGAFTILLNNPSLGLRRSSTKSSNKYSWASRATVSPCSACSVVSRAEAVKSAKPSAHRLRSHLFSSGIPRSSQITIAGSWKEKSSTRLNTSLDMAASSKSLTIFSMFGSKAVTLRGVKDLLTRRRSRVCAGASWKTIQLLTLVIACDKFSS